MRIRGQAHLRSIRGRARARFCWPILLACFMPPANSAMSCLSSEKARRGSCSVISTNAFRSLSNAGAPIRARGVVACV